MLTRLIQRTEAVSKGSIEHEYEYRDAEYEYEKSPERLHGLYSQVVRTFGAEPGVQKHARCPTAHAAGTFNFTLLYF